MGNLAPIINNSDQEKIRDALALLNQPGKRSVREMRKLILGLEAAMKAMPGAMTAENFTTNHYFSPGTYMRELFVPAGIILTGKIHKKDHLNIFLKGKVTVWTEGGVKTLSGPLVFRSLAGMKRAGYVHEDMHWITVHSHLDDERDVDRVEKKFFAETFDEAYLASERTFQDAIHFLGFTPDEVKTISENTADQIPFPAEIDGLRIGESKIHGMGMFATKRFETGSIIAPARVQGKRTPAGRYCNHGSNPNAEMIQRENGNVDLVAIRPIELGDEILNDYYFSYTNSRLTNHIEVRGRHLCQL